MNQISPRMGPLLEPRQGRHGVATGGACRRRAAAGTRNPWKAFLLPPPSLGSSAPAGAGGAYDVVGSSRPSGAEEEKEERPEIAHHRVRVAGAGVAAPRRLRRRSTRGYTIAPLPGRRTWSPQMLGRGATVRRIG